VGNDGNPPLPVAVPQEGEPDSPQNLGDYVKRVRRIDDAEVVAVTVSSAGLCAIGIG
jgi:hypothetical protein